MKLYIDQIMNSGKPYLRLVYMVRRLSGKGIMRSYKKVLKNLGPLDRFDDGKPDFLLRLRESFRSGHPIIPALEEYVALQDTPPTVYNFSIKLGSEQCFAHPKLFSQVIPERIMTALGLNTYVATAKAKSKIQYDVYGFIKLLVFGRLLHPASKCATVRQNEDYYNPVLTGEFNEDDVYDTLSFLYEHKKEIITRINSSLVQKAGRSSKLVYYDVTNFYFETEDPDEDTYDASGNLEKGLRKMGVSKENRRQPIVQMGLFMDDDGIPIAVESFPGNTLDHLTLKQALDKDIKDLELPHFIMVADRGICSYLNLLKLKKMGHGYIVSKSFLKSSKKEQQWALDDEGFIFRGRSFKYKSRIIERTIEEGEGKNKIKRKFKEQVVVYFSQRFQRKAEHENRRFLAFLKKLEESPHSFRVTAGESKTIRKFFKKECLNEETGELVDSSKLRSMVDFQKVREYRKGLGYYQIVTSELDMDPLEVIDKYHGLTQIEDQFRVMKGTLETRPVYVRTREHIEAHLLVCTIALIILRLIQKQIVKSGKVEPSPEAYWNSGLNSDRIQDALNKWCVEALPDGFYRFANVDDPDLKLILDAFHIDIPKQLFTKKELRNIRNSIKIFD